MSLCMKFVTKDPIDAEISYEINPPSTTEKSSTHRPSVYLYQGYYTTIEEVVTSLNYIFTISTLDRSWIVYQHLDIIVEREKFI